MSKTDTAVELCLSGQAFFNPRHSDEHHPHARTVEQVTHLLQCDGVQALGFVDDDPLNEIGVWACDQ